jgi:TonB family protein
VRRINIFSPYAIALLLAVSANTCIAWAQSRAPKPRVTKSSVKNPIRKTVSFGVINGKAIELVKPEYPRVAMEVRVSGFVFVDVLIDKDGKVISAKSRRGHPLLLAASIKAALASAFEPITVSGDPVQVRGVIVYRYLPSSMNWLELGYSADSLDMLIQYLPAGFEDVRTLLEQSRWSSGDSDQTIDSAWSIIDSKLANDEKDRWLTALGRQILELTRSHWNLEKKKASFREIEILLDTCPENVSSQLRSRLAKLIDSKNMEQFDDNLISLTDNLYQLGR